MNDREIWEMQKELKEKFFGRFYQVFLNNGGSNESLLGLSKDEKALDSLVSKLTFQMLDNEKEARNAAEQNVRNLPIWKVIKKMDGDIMQLLWGIKTTDCFGDTRTLNHIEHLISQEECKEIEIKIVKISVTELGFPFGTSAEKIFQRGRELGLELIPVEFVIWFRAQYTDQPDGEILNIVSKPFFCAEGRCDEVFQIQNLVGSCHSGHYLSSHNMYRICEANEIWVFKRP